MRRTFYICVVIGKGGVAKTWWTLNFAHYLGKKGFKVIVVDLNTHRNAYFDCYKASLAGDPPPFACVKANEVADYPEADFVLFDCNQDLSMSTTLAAIDRSDLIVCPIPPDKPDYAIFEDSVRTLHERVQSRDVPVAIIPNKLIALKNNPVNREFIELMEHFRRHGCRLPDKEDIEACPVINSTLQRMETRLIYSKEGAAMLKEGFLKRFRFVANWLFLEVIAPKYAVEPLGYWEFQPETAPAEAQS